MLYRQSVITTTRLDAETSSDRERRVGRNSYPRPCSERLLLAFTLSFASLGDEAKGRIWSSVETWV